MRGHAGGRPRKRSIAVVIEEPDGSGPSWLLVQRPLDDDDLPGAWGLPAGSFEIDESGEALVRRIGRQKLGVDLRPGRAVVSGRTERSAFTLEMTLWTATIEAGSICVPREDRTVTQYRDWAWRPPGALAPGAGRGSLCCRLGLAWAAVPPEGPFESGDGQRGSIA